MQPGFIFNKYTDLMEYLIRQSQITLKLSKEEAEVGVREVERFLYLISMRMKDVPAVEYLPIAYSGDQIYHKVVLCTRIYADICANLPGGVFIHHNPHVSVKCTPRVSNDIIIDNLTWFAEKYIQIFGPFEEKAMSFWAAGDIYELTAEQLNSAHKEQVA